MQLDITKLRLSIMRITIFILFFGIFTSLQAQQQGFNRNEVLFLINDLRASGCKCGNQMMRPVGSVTWNDKLVKSATLQIKMMQRYNLFAHIGPDGKDVADKMEAVGYRWNFAGENLGEGQKDFKTVFIDWLKSRTHCELLMDGRMNEMGLVRSGKYWVLHMGKQLPKNAYRVTERYIEN